MDVGFVRLKMDVFFNEGKEREMRWDGGDDEGEAQGKGKRE